MSSRFKAGCFCVTFAKLLVGVGVFLVTATTSSRADEQPTYTVDEREHWAYQPIKSQAAPDVGQLAATPVDAFVIRKLKSEGLSLNRMAERVTLVRRLSFDLLGLPPKPATIDRFVADTAPDAYTRLVDSLLADPRYGERWGQHWLDVVRFAESEGYEYDRHIPGAWRFRDFVITSFNEDQPFDRFVTEQIAGDELADKSNISPLERNRLLVAAGFHRLGAVRRNAGNPDVAFSRNEVLTERTDIVGAAFLGLTVGCARCHDHMYDAIRQQDYYQLQAFLSGTNEHNVELASAAEQAAWKQKTQAVQLDIDRIKKQLATATGDKEQQLTKALYAAQDRLPAPLAAIMTVVDEPSKRTPIHLLRRGDPGHPGRRLGMRPLGIISAGQSTALPAATLQPRTRLAKWLTDPSNPLTARVIVNRIWQHHFGRGLVETANDLGVNGELPTHPKLLDFLAAELIRSQWRLKRIHRLILLSRTYRQSSVVTSDHPGHELDPENTWLWRFQRRRLDGEEIRDAMLSVSGRLNLQIGGPSILVPVDADLVQLLYKPSQWHVTPDRRQHDRRSVYLIAKRNLQVPFLELFDKPDLQTSCAGRKRSTHAPQSLEMLNGSLSNELAQSFAKRIAKTAGASIHQQVLTGFKLATGRKPTQTESELAERFLATQPHREFALGLFNLNAFLYVD